MYFNMFNTNLKCLKTQMYDYAHKSIFLCRETFLPVSCVATSVILLALSYRMLEAPVSLLLCYNFCAYAQFSQKN